MISETSVLGVIAKLAWPLLPAGVLILVGYGALNKDVEAIKQQQVVVAEDHDRIIRMEAEQKAMARDIDEIKAAVKDIQREVKRSND